MSYEMKIAQSRNSTQETWIVTDHHLSHWFSTC